MAIHTYGPLFFSESEYVPEIPRVHTSMYISIRRYMCPYIDGYISIVNI